MVLTNFWAKTQKKTAHPFGDTLSILKIRIILYLDLYLNTTWEFELHQSVNSLSS